MTKNNLELWILLSLPPKLRSQVCLCVPPGLVYSVLGQHSALRTELHTVPAHIEDRMISLVTELNVGFSEHWCHESWPLPLVWLLPN